MRYYLGILPLPDKAASPLIIMEMVYDKTDDYKMVFNIIDLELRGMNFKVEDDVVILFSKDVGTEYRLKAQRAFIECLNNSKAVAVEWHIIVKDVYLNTSVESRYYRTLIHRSEAPVDVWVSIKPYFNIVDKEGTKVNGYEQNVLC